MTLKNLNGRNGTESVNMQGSFWNKNMTYLIFSHFMPKSGLWAHN